MNRYFPKQDTDVQRFRVTNHQGNADQAHRERPPHACPTAVTRDADALRCGCEGPCAPLAETQPGAATAESSAVRKRTSR